MVVYLPPSQLLQTAQIIKQLHQTPQYSGAMPEAGWIYYRGETILFFLSQYNHKQMESQLFSLRVKLVSMKIKHNSKLKMISLRCTLGDRILTEKQAVMSDGLLSENITLAFQMDAQTIQRGKQIVLTVFQKFGGGSSIIRIAYISFKEFEHTNMRKLHFQSHCAEEDDYFEAFLLKIPIRNATQPNSGNYLPIKNDYFQSSISIHLENSSVFDDASPKTSRQILPSLKKTQSQQAQTQTVHLQSLITINSILEETNCKLQAEKMKMEKQIHKLQQKLEQHQRVMFLNKQYRERIQQMNDEIQELKIQLSESQKKLQHSQREHAIKEQQLERKNQTIEQLKKGFSRSEKQMERKGDRKLQQDLKTLNIDQMMLELNKYSETAKRYKNYQKDGNGILNSKYKKQCSENPDIIPVSSKSPLSLQTLTSNRQMPMKPRKQTSFRQQTLDSLTQSKVS